MTCRRQASSDDVTDMLRRKTVELRCMFGVCVCCFRRIMTQTVGVTFALYCNFTVHPVANMANCIRAGKGEGTSP